MRVNNLIFIFIFQIFTVFGQGYNKKYGNPIIILSEADPSIESSSYSKLGLNAPTFVLYENGQILFRKMIAKELIFFESIVEKNDIQKFIKKIGLTDKLIKKLPKQIQATEVSCQAFTNLTIRLDSIKNLFISGNIRNPKSDDRKRIPKNIMTVYDNLTGYDDKSAKQWIPEYIEVNLTDANDFPGRIIHWSENLANLNNIISKDTLGQTYKVLIEKKNFKEFYRIMSNVTETATILHNGRNVSVWFQLHYPNLN